MKDYQQLLSAIEEFRTDCGFKQRETLETNLYGLLEEVSEVFAEFRFNSQEQANVTAVGHEIADVFIYLVSLCQMLDIDLYEVTRDKLGINKGRFLPAELQSKIYLDNKF